MRNGIIDVSFIDLCYIVLEAYDPLWRPLTGKAERRRSYILLALAMKVHSLKKPVTVFYFIFFFF